MDTISFYTEVKAYLKKVENSIFDKFKLDNSDLVNAVKNDDPELVAKTLNAWVNPNKEDGMGRLALPFAIDNNNNLIAGMLLHRKADPNVLGEDGKNPLTKAVSWKNEDLLYLLLGAGAEVNFKNKDGSTALDEAKKIGSLRMEKILKGIKIAAKVEQVKKDTATHEKMKKQAEEAKLKKDEIAQTKAEAENQAREESIKLKYFPKGESKMFALIKAIKAKDSEGVRYLVKDIENINDNNGENTPLAVSVNLGNQKLSEFLMKEGGDIFLMKEGSNDYEIFQSAIRAKQYDLVEYALSIEEDPKQFLNDQEQRLSAQFLAYKDPKMFNILVNAGADPFFGGKDGICPVIKAIEKGSIAILPVLTKHKIDVLHISEGKSLLEWSIIHSRLDWINGLISEGALKDLTEKEKSKLLDLASQEDKKNKEIIELLNKG